MDRMIYEVINNGMEAAGTYICKEVEVMEMEVEATYRHKEGEVMEMDQARADAAKEEEAAQNTMPIPM